MQEKMPVTNCIVLVDNTHVNSHIYEPVKMCIITGTITTNTRVTSIFKA